MAKRKFRVKMPKDGKTPCNRPKKPYEVCDAGSAVGRAVLESLGSAQLYKLLQLKNIPDRSKARKKEDRVQLLTEVTTRADLEAIGLEVPAPDSSHKCTGSNLCGELKIRAGYGVRLNEDVGSVDVHEHVLVAGVVTPSGREVERQFPNSAEGLRSLDLLYRHFHVRHVAFESTAEYWLKPLWALEDAGYDVLVANPGQTKATQGDKTDWNDALRIAYALRDGRLKPSILCTPEQYARRKLVRDAKKKVQQGGKALSRLDAMFEMFDAPEWVKKLPKSQRGRGILYQCLALPAEVRVGDFQEILTEGFAKGKGKIDDPAALLRMAAELVVFLYHLGKVPGNRVRFAQHLEEYVMFRRMATELRTEALKSAAGDERLLEDITLLAGMPDVGVNSALSAAIEVVDARYFRRAKSVAKWAGLAPRVNQSGHKKRSTGHIYKGGNKYLRNTCFDVAKVSFAHAGEEGHPIGDFASRLYHSGKKAYKVAVTAGARKFLTLAYHVLTERRPFAEVWPELAAEEAEANRQRKLKELQKRVKGATTSDLLPCVLASLRRQTDSLSAADAAYADEIVALLGSAYPVEIA